MILSPILSCVELICVVVPATIKFPAILTFEPVSWIAVLNADVKEFNDVLPLLAVKEFTDAVAAANWSILVICKLLVVLLDWV